MISRRALPVGATGALCGIAAAALFGLSTPLAKLLVPQSSPLVLAGLLYLGAASALGLAALARRRSSSAEAPLRRSDIPLLLGVIITGGIIGPVLMLIGIARISAVAGSLLLNLEAPFTMLIAVAIFGEHLGLREAAAAGVIVLGGASLSWGVGELSGEGLGLLAIAGACLSWAVDNNLTQRLSLRDPLSIVRLKALGAGAGNLLLAMILGMQFPGHTVFFAALLVGAVSYGLSIVLDTYALRLVGAAREAAYFATAPFFGALVAAAVLGEAFGRAELGAGLAMGLGVVLLFGERHTHDHEHTALVHDHLHTHDEHHQHDHADGTISEPHAHVHTHTSLSHAHPHVSDAHHRHGHGWKHD